MSEWFKELVLKTSDAANVRGFESHSDRQIFAGVSRLFVFVSGVKRGRTTPDGCFFDAENQNQVTLMPLE